MVLHRGKIATKPEILEIRPLTRDDLSLIVEKREPGNRSGGSAVTRFRDPHHRLARLFAAGLKTGEVAERSGYSINRVSQLRTDPAFEELIAKYREKVDAAFVENVDEFYETATANMRVAERMIAERLEEADDEGGSPIPLKTLVDISADRMDRFGYGKRQTNVNVNVDFAKQLEDAIARSGKAKVIEATCTSPVPSAPQSPLRLSPPIPAPASEGSQQPPLRRRA